MVDFEVCSAGFNSMVRGGVGSYLPDTRSVSRRQKDGAESFRCLGVCLLELHHPPVRAGVWSEGTLWARSLGRPRASPATGRGPPPPPGTALGLPRPLRRARLSAGRRSAPAS